MEIIGKIAVKRNKKERAKKTWLTIGLVAFVLTMICEVLLGNFAFLALIVPFLYLLNLRNKMGKSILYKDVAIRIDGYDGENIVEISNCEYRDRVLYSARFSLQENSEICVSYFVSDERISIACIARKVLFLGNTIIPIFEHQPYDIQFYVSLDDAKKIAEKLQGTLIVKR